MSTAERYANELWVCHLGVVPYGEALELQNALRAQRQAGELPDTLLLLEHPPVYTRGRRADAEDLPFPAAFYEERGIEIHDVDRGGRITYHGPGQLVGYPIMAVADVGRFVRTMETAIVDALAAELVVAHARPEDGPDYTGVWIEDDGRDAPQRKIASIGVHVQRGVSTHGFAVNVHNDLTPFSWIVACGLADVTMTSLELERPEPPATDGTACAARLRCFRRRAADSFSRVHGRRQRLVTPQRLGLDEDRTTWRAPERAPSAPAHEALSR